MCIRDRDYTTAHDMGLILKEAMKHEEFRKISGTISYTLKKSDTLKDTLAVSYTHLAASMLMLEPFLLLFHKNLHNKKTCPDLQDIILFVNSSYFLCASLSILKHALMFNFK